MKADKGTAKAIAAGEDQPVARADRPDTRTQAEKFEAAARELGCDPDEDRFKVVLRKLAMPKN